MTQIRRLAIATVFCLFAGLSAFADAPASVPAQAQAQCQTESRGFFGRSTRCIPPTQVHDGEHWGGGEVSCPAGQTPVYSVTQVYCAPVFADAGRFCTAASQCVGECLASVGGNSGTCARTQLGAGCFELLMDDGERVGLCID